MRALVFGVDPASGGEVDARNRTTAGAETSAVLSELAASPTALRERATPTLPASDWVLVRTLLCGICGSDVSQLLLRAEADNPLASLVSLPHVPGHEVVGEIVEAGREAPLRVGQRVAIDPWLGCAARAVTPPCRACAAGRRSQCQRLTDGQLSAGMHLGTCADVPGGFGEVLAAHHTMCFPVPDDVDDEAAVLADPFAVALHAVVRHPPPSRARVLVYGAGTIGLAVLAVLRALRQDVSVMAVARFDHQAALADNLGARVVRSDPCEEVVAAVARWSGARVRPVLSGLPWLYPGGADVVYDAVGTAETFEVGLRVLRACGRLVALGVAPPARFEWTPVYVKELELTGSSGYGMESVAGRRQHAIEHYLALLRSGRVDPRPFLTHRFRLTEWRQAVAAAADHARSAAVKVAFDFR